MLHAEAVAWCHYSLGREEEPTSLSVTGRLGRPREGRLGAIPSPVQEAPVFVELVFDSGDEQAPSKFTTQVRVVPAVLPHTFEEFRKTLK